MSKLKTLETWKSELRGLDIKTAVMEANKDKFVIRAFHGSERAHAEEMITVDVRFDRLNVTVDKGLVLDVLFIG